MTPERLLELIHKADDEQHGLDQCYIDEDLCGMSRTIVDGKLNLVRIAELITEDSRQCPES